MTEIQPADHVPNMANEEIIETIELLRQEALRRKIEERKDAARRVVAFAAEQGFSTIAEVRRALDASMPDFDAKKLYVNPDDPSLTWGGRGRKPAWLKDLEVRGVDIETLRG